MKLEPTSVLKLSDHITHWKGWLREPTFYIYGLIYSFVRITL